MTDLVTRLRTRGCWLCNGDCAAANPPVTYCPVKEDNEAADEIERLQARVTELDPVARLLERAERAEAELVALRVLVSPAAEQAMRDLRAERDALRALLVSVPTYLASLEARITHSCPLKDGATTLRNAINAALRERS